MRHTILILLMAASAAAAYAQTPANHTAAAMIAAKPATTTAKSSATAPKSTSASVGVVLPPGVPPVKGIQKTAFSLRYQEIKVGTGAEAEPNKIYKVYYTGWLATDGKKFDSTDDHRTAVLDKDKKPVLDANGKPQLGDPQPLSFPQGYGRLIPGWDQGFYGMKIGGKRRLFIPWQLAYGAKGRPGPDAAHPVIPPQADLIFDVELLDVTDLPLPTNHPSITGTSHPAQSVAPVSPAAPATATPTTAPAAATAAPATPAQPQSK